MRDNPARVDRRTFAQDFFFELMRDSQRVRAVYLAERERWIRTLEIAGREEVLFELEMLLRGIDGFFTLRNLFGEKQPPGPCLPRRAERSSSTRFANRRTPAGTPAHDDRPSPPRFARLPFPQAGEAMARCARRRLRTWIGSCK